MVFDYGSLTIPLDQKPSDREYLDGGGTRVELRRRLYESESGNTKSAPLEWNTLRWEIFRYLKSNLLRINYCYVVSTGINLTIPKFLLVCLQVW